MPIDATIPLGAKVPDQMQNLSGLLNAANTAQTVQNNNISLNERKAVQGVLADPSNYTDDQGNIDFNRALPAVMRVAPTTGMKYVQDLMTAQKQQTDAKQALNNLNTDVRTQAGKVLYGMPPDTPLDVFNGTIDALSKQYKGGDTYWQTLKQGYAHAVQQGKGPDFLANAAKTTLPQDAQQALNTPSGVTIDNGQQSALVNLKPGVQGVPQGEIVQGTQVRKVLPPGQQDSTITDAMGNLYVQHRDAFGGITGTTPLQSSTPAVPGTFRLPPNETKATMDDLQGQRTDALTAARNAGTMHDINRTIVQEASKGFSTGSLGALRQKITSATGYQFDPNDTATDYNVLGKYLERSALAAAQSMGPHTNAGLEAAVRANGSLDYTPQALKKIAYLNDALVTGSQLYSQGLEKAIESSPNGVFAKRQFDQEWGKAATPQALRLKNAVDTGNQEEIQNIVKEVGGKGTKGAQQLHAQLQKLLQLAGQQ
jgi:hypothetical protein